MQHLDSYKKPSLSAETLVRDQVDVRPILQFFDAVNQQIWAWQSQISYEHRVVRIYEEDRC